MPSIWANDLSGPRAIPSLTVDPADRIYVGFGSNLAGLDKVSSDTGQTWVTTRVITRFLAASRSAVGTVYGVVDGGPNVGFTSIGRTTDGGVTWQRWSATRADRSDAPFSTQQIVVDPLDSETIYALGVNMILRSLDGGHTFDPYIDVGSTMTAFALSIDGARWWIIPENDALYTSTDEGVSWTLVSLPEPMKIEQLVASPHDARSVFVVSDRSAFVFRLSSGS